MSSINTDIVTEFVERLWDKDYLRIPVSPREFFTSTYYFGIFAKGLWPTWLANLEEVLDPQNKISEWCLTGSTKIPIIDEHGGLDVSLKELAATKESFRVYSINKSGDRVIGTGHSCRKTGLSREVWRVELSNGRELFATPDHLFMLRCSNYKRVDELSSGMFLMSLYCSPLQVVATGFSHYEDVYDLTVDQYHNFATVAGVYVHNCITGGIGIGKSLAASAAQEYKLYELSCLSNPHDFYGLMPTSPISIAMFSSDKEKARNTVTGKLINMINGSPYFRETFPASMRKTAYDFTQRQEDVEVRLPKHLKIISGSRTRHALSEDIIGGILDETNFREGKGGWDAEGANSALAIYEAISFRRTSRFKELGDIPGLMCLVSSRRSTQDFLDIYIQKIKNNPDVKVNSYALWDVKDPKKYKKTFFYVQVGAQSSKHKILTLEEEKKYDLTNKSIIKIPDDFRLDFEKNLISAIRDLAGFSTSPYSYYIDNIEVVTQCMKNDRPHPFGGEIIPGFKATQGFIGVRDSTRLISYIEEKGFVQKRFDGVYQPLHHPRAIRALHVDLSKTGDATGISMGCVPNLLTTIEIVGSDKEVPVHHPNVWMDFMFRVKNFRGDKIDFDKIVDFIKALRDGYKFPIEFVSYDGWQGEHSIQLLEKYGFKAIELSVERTTLPYDSFMDLCHTKRIDMYYHDFLVWELSNLIRFSAGKKDKIDHAPNTSNDVSDSSVAVCHRLLSEYNAGNIEINADRDMAKIAEQAMTQQTQSEDDWIFGDYEPLGRS